MSGPLASWRVVGEPCYALGAICCLDEVVEARPAPP